MANGFSFRNATTYLGRLPFANRLAFPVFRNGLSVFMFHRVLAEGEECYEPELSISKKVFEELLDWLSDDFEILPLDELVKWRTKPRASRKPMCAITFDDGWVDNYLHAFQPLRERKLPATIFLPVRFIGTNRRFWQDRLWLCRRRLAQCEDHDRLIETAARHFPWFPLGKDFCAHPLNLRQILLSRSSKEAEEFVQCLSEVVGLPESTDRAFLNWEEVSVMHKAGISFGSHTLNHTLLTALPPAQLLPEIADSRKEIQERLGADVPSFSYPWGVAGALARDVVKEAGYSCAVVTAPGGLVGGRDDDWMLPRLALSDSIVAQNGEFDSNKTVLTCATKILLRRHDSSTDRRVRKVSGRIKIAFVIDQISEWEGGTERQLRTVIQSLDRRYFDPELRFIFKDPALCEKSLPCKAEWICPDPHNAPSIIRRLFRLVRNLQKSRPHIVQGFFIEGIVLGTIAAKLARVPTVIASKRNSGHWGQFHHHFAFRWIAKLASAWQCNSRATWEYERNVDKIPAARLELLPNALDLSQFVPATVAERSAIRKKLGINESGPIFVLVAALIPVKDIATLIKAVKRVRPTWPTVQVWIVGDGPLRCELEELARQLDLTDTVRFAGVQSNVRPYLAAADFGVLTSISEGSSNSILEYMAMGLPSVVSDIRPNRELVSGLFFEAGDDKALADNLLKISADTELQAKLRSENLNTAQQFSLERFVARIQSYYHRLVAETNGGY